MDTSSSSDGEISEKANSHVSTKKPSVNSILRQAISPSPEPLPYSVMATTSTRRRSRSPYRGGYSSRGEKRRREDEHQIGRTGQDTRRFRVHYEENKSRHLNTGRGGGDRYLDYDERRLNEGPSYKRPRTRSRSPSHDDRRGRDNRYDGRGGSRGGLTDFRPASGEYDRNGENKALNHHQSLNAREVASHPNNHMSKREAEHLYVSQKHSNEMNAYSKKPRFAEHDSMGRAVPIEQPEPVTAAPIDENQAIEERRRRREAIKAKHNKTPGTPLLVQALHLGNSTANSSQPGSATPISDRSESPGPSSPGTAMLDSAHNSPPTFIICDDAELANTNIAAPSTPGGDEPSAADYDPTMDMQEDRFRNDQRRNGEDVAACAYDETKGEKRDIILADSTVATIEEKITKPAKGADDMFASDNEDDMFAPVAPKKTSDADEEPSKVSVPKAKELDMSLLDNWDDHEGYYKIILGELLDSRYHVQANLGKGMFSSVVRATDTTNDTLKAIKVIRNNETMTKAAVKEMEILKRLAEADPEDKKHLIRLERSFMHKGHLCMVFEHLSINLREVLKKFGRDVGINLKAVRSYAQQMLLGLSLMKKCNILHADLKPDNILVNDARNLLKICDLGSAADAGENDITPYLVSRFYRAPEIILGIPYDFAIDMWSIGCTLFELYTGKILFTGRTNNQMLRNIMECRGKFSLKMLKKAEFGAVHFDDHNLNFRSMERDKITGKELTRLINFVKPTRDLKSRLLATAGSAGGKLLPEADLKELNLFADLLDRCLALNAEKRLTPLEALKHPFIYRGPGNGALLQPTKR